MIITVYAVSLTGLLLLPVVLLFLLDRKLKRQEHQRLISHLNEAAHLKELRFSSQEILKGLAIGLDGVNRMLVLVDKMHGYNFYSTIINLDNMEACTTWRQYTSVSRRQGIGENKTEGVKSIILQLHLGEKKTVEIPFYRHYKDKASELQALEKKARQWESVLSKMIMPVKKRA